MQNWFKFYGGEFLTDTKMDNLEAWERSCWLTLLCYASVSDIPGEVKHLDEYNLLKKSGVLIEGIETTEEGLQTYAKRGVFEKFEKLELIKRDDNGMITIINYRKKQGSSLTAYERVKKSRLMKRKDNAMITVDTNDNKMIRPRIDKNRIDKNRIKKERSFTPPFLEEVKNYCLERKNGINAQDFLDFYESKGWLIGKNKMKDWRAAIRTWENRNKPVVNQALKSKYEGI